MSYKILCPFHKESTPSCVVYEDSFKCYACGAYGKNSQLTGIDTSQIKERYVEPIEETLEYISKLPKSSIRGLSLHEDSDSYYILWPNRSYYKKRSKGDSKSKYKCPAGHEKPLLVLEKATNGVLVICEGEINAMSIAESTPFTVCSPGSATDFDSPKSAKYLPYYLQFDTMLVVVDNDAPGALAAIALKSKLLQYKKHVMIKLMDEDANDLLVKYGKEKVREEIYRSLGM